MSRATAVFLGVILAASVLAADDHIVQFDRTVDFSAIKTFGFRNSAIKNGRPELDNPLMLKAVTAAIRRALVAVGLTETTDRPDAFIEFSVAGDGPFGSGAVTEQGAGRGRRGRGQPPPAASQPQTFSQGVLVIDVVARQSDLLIWRGVYRDSTKESEKFARHLIDDTAKLLSNYPPKGR